MMPVVAPNFSPGHEMQPEMNFGVPFLIPRVEVPIGQLFSQALDLNFVDFYSEEVQGVDKLLKRPRKELFEVLLHDFLLSPIIPYLKSKASGCE